jgi:hypothetical protein
VGAAARTQLEEARAAFRELLRENQFIAFRAAVERGGKVPLEQAMAVVQARA